MPLRRRTLPGHYSGGVTTSSATPAILSACLLSGFTSLADDAAHAPARAVKLALADMAAREVAAALALEEQCECGGPARRQTELAIADFHRRARPQDWPERLVKTYVAGCLLRDLLQDVTASDNRLPQTVVEHYTTTSLTELVLAELSEPIEADPQLAARLSLWGRRVMGEVLAMVRHLVNQVPDILPPDQAAGEIAQLTTAHSARMAALGLTP